MNTIDQTRNGFSFPRFRALTRRYFVENRKILLTGALATLGGMLLIAVLMGRWYNPGNHPWSSDYGEEQALLFWGVIGWIFSIYAIVMSSLTFSAYKTKPGRIHSLMVPAAASEKFWLLVLVYNLLTTIVYFISAVICDGVRALVAGGAPTIWRFFETIHIGGVHCESLAFLILCPIAMLLFSQAVYTFGSALWPRRSFIKTFGACFVVTMLLPVLIPSNIDFLDSFFESNLREIRVWLWTFVGLAYAVDCGIFYLAWRRFRSMQIVQTFMMN